MSQSPIGLVGVGLLGTALAERMIAAGNSLLAFDISHERLKPFHAAASAADVAAKCQTVVFCLPDSRMVRSMIESLTDQLRSAALLIDATTGDPDDTAQLATALRQRGVGYVDATIAGSSDQVRRGEAVVLIGGEAADVERATPILSSWSAKRYHLGPPASGARMKLVVNLVLGLNRAVLAEGLALAEACGIDAALALQVLRTTPTYSTAMDTKGPKMIARDFSPQARLSQHFKDVRLIRELAQRHGASVPLSTVHERLLERAVAMGLGDADNSAVMGVYSAEHAAVRGTDR
jgi:3-hydroxyisobutyrate dehydrogenase and related beta-hydroxyacid dehydrogenases